MLYYHLRVVIDCYDVWYLLDKTKELDSADEKILKKIVVSVQL